MRQDSVLLAFGSYPWICENVARAACTLWSRGSWLGGALVSALCFCCFLAHRLLYGTLLSVFRFCFTLPYQSLRWYNVIISSCIFQLPMNWSADHRPCWFLFLFWFGLFAFCVFVCFVCFCVFGVCFLSCTVTAQWIMYRSISVLFCITLSLWPMLLLH